MVACFFTERYRIMGKKDKLQSRFKEQPKDFKWPELCRLLKQLGFKAIEGDGSRVKFYREETKCMISLHRPHPENIIKSYVMRDVLKKLTEDKVWKK